MGMGYYRLMGYGIQIPAHQTGGQIRLWVKRGYGLSGVWDKRGSTVPLKYHALPSVRSQILFVCCLLTFVTCQRTKFSVASLQPGLVT